MEKHRAPRQRIFRDAADAGSRCRGRVSLAGPFSLFPFLGSDADSHGVFDRHLGTRSPRVCSGEVRALHDGRLDPDAGRHRLVVQRHGHVRSADDSDAAAYTCVARWPGARAENRSAPLPGFLSRVCNQGAALPLAHLAPGCARGSAHGRVGDAGRCAAENGDVRHDSLLLAALPGSFAPRCGLGGSVGDHRHYLRRAGGDGAAKLEEAGRLLVRQPPWLRSAGDFRVPQHFHAGRGLPDAGARNFDGRALFARRHAVRPAAHV